MRFEIWKEASQIKTKDLCEKDIGKVLVPLHYKIADGSASIKLVGMSIEQIWFGPDWSKADTSNSEKWSWNWI